MRIGLIQMRCEKDSISENIDSMASYIKEAAARKVDILGFPEACITGYFNPQIYPEAAIRLDGEEVKHLVSMTRGYTFVILAGLVEENPGEKPFLTQVVIRDGSLLGYYRKKRIVEEEAELYSSGLAVPVFSHKDLTFGISICADIGAEDVFAESAKQGARMVFELAAPGLYGDQVTRNWQSGFNWWKGECNQYLSSYARQYGLWIGVATQAGRTVDEDFPGGGYLFNPHGDCVCSTPDGSEGGLYVEIDLKEGIALQI
jgi:predicted amidohydrolase